MNALSKLFSWIVKGAKLLWKYLWDNIPVYVEAEKPPPKVSPWATLRAGLDFCLSRVKTLLWEGDPVVCQPLVIDIGPSLCENTTCQDKLVKTTTFTVPKKKRRRSKKR